MESVHVGIFIPYLSIQAHINKYPECFKKAFYLTTQSAKQQRSVVFQVSPQAHRLGIYPKSNIQYVQKKHPNTPHYAFDKKYQLELLHQLQDHVNELSPFSEVSAQGLLHLNLSGTQRLFQNDFSSWFEQLQSKLNIFPHLKYTSVLANSKTYATLLAKYYAYHKPQSTLHKVNNHPTEIAAIPILYTPNIHPKTKHRLYTYNMENLGDIQKIGLNFLKQNFPYDGERLWYLCQGQDLAKQKQTSQSKTIHLSHTFNQDENNTENIHKAIHKLTDQMAFTLRQENRKAKNILLEITYSDNKKFKKKVSIPQATHVYLQLKNSVQSLIPEVHTRRVSIRSIQIYSHQTIHSQTQMDLFQQAKHDKNIAIQDALDKVRNKHGFTSVISAH